MNLFDAMSSSPVLLIGLVFFLGLLVGSFLNVVIHRLPRMMEAGWRRECRELLEQPEQTEPTFNLIVPRSRCPHCGHEITWYENIPVVSWLGLRGRCSECKARISPRYPIVEIVAALMGALAAWRFGYGPYLVFILFFCWTLLALAMIDFDTTLLPDSLTYPLLWAGILVAWLNIGPVSLKDALAGTMAGYLFLWSIYWLFKLLTGKEGMGFGDFKLFAALGAWMGWKMLPLILLLSSAVGAVVGVLLISTGAAKRDQGIPFGPYLAGAGWIALMWGHQIVSAYLGLMKF